ncbi:MAG TPA: hypothetical protein ENH01_12265 [Nitrospirae bacterium]|nr:hypothetical protein [Nitrospirota bacterium]
MPDRVVCNASPLIFLGKINRLELLDNFKLYVPSQVEAEIARGLKLRKEDAQQIIHYLDSRKIEAVKTPLLKNLPHFLGSGERAVISLAVRNKIGIVLIDEAKARTVARFRGLKTKGTLGILWDSFKSGMIDRETTELLSLDLMQKGYRIREEILIEFLKRLKKIG